MKTVLLVDGGYLRVAVRSAGMHYDGNLITRFCWDCFDNSEYLFRIMYYDALQYDGRVKRPVSGEEHRFQANDEWLEQLGRSERFAVRLGSLSFRGWRPRQIPTTDRPMRDSDFEPIFEQKGVDMRVGLDIATFCEKRSADRLLLLSGDTDMVPAMKYARKAGLEVGLIQLPEPAYPLHNKLRLHADFIRRVNWPNT